MPERDGCKHPEQHHQHLCALRDKLAKHDLDLYTCDPHYVCGNCGGRTREGKHLCNPKRLKK